MVARRPDGHRVTVDHEQVAAEKAAGVRCARCGMPFGDEDVRYRTEVGEMHRRPCAIEAGYVQYARSPVVLPELSRKDLFGV
jgi:hypothetical protein